MLEFKVSIQKDERNIRKLPFLVRWKGEFDPHTGRQKKYCKSFAKRKYAEQFAQQKKEEFEAGLPRDERHISLQQLCDKFLLVNQKEYRNGTLGLYKNTISNLLTYFHPTTPLQHIRQEHAQAFIAQVDYIRKHYKGNEGDLSDSARNIKLRNCKTIFSTAVEWKYIIENPFAKIKQVKPTTQPWHRFTVEEFNAIIEQTPTLEKKALYTTLYGIGLRLGEALNILTNGHNIDFEAEVITVQSRPANETMPPFLIKDKESRTVPMPKWVSKILKQLYQEHDPDNPFLFLTKARWELVQQTWQKMRQAGKAREWQNWRLLCNTDRDFKNICRKAGIQTDEGIHLHCLRKSWACNLAENGIAPKTLCELGGWSKPETLHEYYTKVSDANRDKARRVLDDLMNGD